MNLLNRRQAHTRDEGEAVRRFLRVNIQLGDEFQWRRVPPDRHGELIELTEKLDNGNGMCDWTKLSKGERTTLEQLVATGAGKGPDWFEQQRHDAYVAAEFEKLRVKSRRRPTLKRGQEKDLLDVLMRQLESGHLWLSHVAILVYVLGVLHTGKPLSPAQSIEGSGDDARLVADHTWGLIPAPVDGLGVFANWQMHVEWLAEHNWITLAKAGPQWRIGLGPKLLTALRHSAGAS